MVLFFVQAAGRAIGTQAADRITRATGRAVSPGQAQAAVAVLVGLGLRYALFPPGTGSFGGGAGAIPGGGYGNFDII